METFEGKVSEPFKVQSCLLPDAPTGLILISDTVGRVPPDLSEKTIVGFYGAVLVVLRVSGSTSGPYYQRRHRLIKQSP